MRIRLVTGVLAIAMTASGCGDGDGDGDEPEPEREVMPVEETVFGDVVGAQDRARDDANDAVDVHRKALEERLEADEGAPAGD